jgi:uncharacterized protein (TIGR03435 family)
MPSRPNLAPIVVVSLVFFASTRIHAQPPAHKGPAAAIALAKTVQPFDVVSIKRNITGAGNYGLKSGDTGLSATNVTLRFLIQFAYDVKSDFITGLSGPVDSAHFDVEAKVVPQDGSTPKLPDDQILAMLIRLLADRFQLKVHLESQSKPVYDLVVAKGGPMIKLSQGEIHDSSGNISFHGTNKVLTAKGFRVSDLADALSETAGRKVIDKTGLIGHADITLKWSDEIAMQQGGADAVSIFTAVEDQLGLKLVPSKGPVDILVVDHAEMPTAD